MKQIKKFFFSLKKPRIIFIGGQGKETLTQSIISVLKNFIKVKKIKNLPFLFDEKEILILENEKDFKYLIRESSLPILIATHFTDIPPQNTTFASEIEDIKNLIEISKFLPPFGYLIFNQDDETLSELKKGANSHVLTFGFSQFAQIRASDIKLNKGINFKLHHNGSILPVWLEGVFGKEQVYCALATFCLAKILKLNLVEVSLAFKNYKSLPGKMKLVEGIKNSWILDDSESATPFSMIEAIEILGKIDWAKRKIAVLGDVIGIGKYTIQAHETIGEYVKKNADFLFTFGQRAKFIAKGAFEKGMEGEKIFSFDRIEDGIDILKEKIEKDDLILVDGSKEMEMSKIVKEIKK